jgi:predicted 2-oxoglutarate/Fe(II)-dependent dioxygenase YbiX
MDEGVAEPAEVVEEPTDLPRGGRRALSIEVDARTLADVEAALDGERAAIAAFLRLQLALREGAGFIRYLQGGGYGLHRDRGDLASEWPQAARRQVSLVLFLNSSADAEGGGFTGGVLHLVDEGVEIVPRQGMLVAFRATTLHEVTPVTSGTRDVVVDWFY